MLTSRRKAHLIIVTAFMLGIAAGASGQYLLFMQPPPARTSTVAEVADELTQVLKLDQSQRSQVEQVLSECQHQYQELKNQTRPQFQSVREKARNRIRSLLSPEQQTLYNQWVRSLDSKRDKRNSEEGRQTGK